MDNNFTYLYIGMSGQKMVDTLNANFREIIDTFTSISDDLTIRIISSNIKEIKEENNVVYYTTDDSDVEERNWKSLQASWGSIVGNITNQQDLVLALGDKVSTTDFNTLTNTVSSNTGRIVLLEGTTTSNTSRIQNLENIVSGANGVLTRLSNIDDTLAEKISSDQILAIRIASESALEYTTDGTTWKPVADVGSVEWGSITGDIANQADLQLIVQEMDNAITSMNQHISNTENPHNVTAAQLGLGNVDNTADTDKPMSTPQTQYFNANKPVVVITKDDYEDLEEIKSDVFYIISDL